MSFKRHYCFIVIFTAILISGCSQNHAAPHLAELEVNNSLGRLTPQQACDLSPPVAKALIVARSVLDQNRSSEEWESGIEVLLNAEQTATGWKIRASRLMHTKGVVYPILNTTVLILDSEFKLVEVQSGA